MKNDSPLPDYYYNSFIEIDFSLLREKGIKNLIIDVDNTLALAGSDVLDPGCKKLLEGLLSEDKPFKICLVSNIIFGAKRKARVQSMANSIGVPFVAADFFNRKPQKEPFITGLQLMEAEASNTAVIGDQMFTDILGGNRLGMITVLINPLGPDHWATSLTGRRKREKALLEGMKPQKKEPSP